MRQVWYIAAMGQDTTFFGLVRFRRIPVPSLKGLIVILVLSVVTWPFLCSGIYTFFSTTRPLGEGMLVVEGWVPDYAIQYALETYRRGAYSRIVTTGVPIEAGQFLSEYGTTAEVARATLLKLGAPAEQLSAAPVQGHIVRDRTMASAVALDDWIKRSGPLPRTIDIVTVGPHARRTRMLFQRVLGDSIAVGVIAVPETSYGPDTWWQTSAGVKDVVGEVLGYVYAATGLTSISRKK